VTSAQQPALPNEFIVTREYRRFVEFCDACRQARYIGLCYGVPGVGKTVSARQYARWDELEAVLGPPPHRHDGIPPPDSGPWQTILYTPGVVNTPRIIERDVGGLWRAVQRQMTTKESQVFACSPVEARGRCASSFASSSAGLMNFRPRARAVSVRVRMPARRRSWPDPYRARAPLAPRA